jgi:hypothetical protein
MPKATYPSLIQGVADYLCEKGFRQRSLGFNRPGADEECIDGVTIQRGVRSLVGRFTIELGLCVPKIQTLVHPEIELPRFPHAWHGIFRERLAQTAGWKDHWWMSDKKEDFPEIILLLERSGWPFLERWNSQERIVKNLLEDRRSGKAAHQSMSTVVPLNGAGFAHEARKILQEIYEGYRDRNVDTVYVDAIVERLQLKL